MSRLKQKSNKRTKSLSSRHVSNDNSRIKLEVAINQSLARKDFDVACVLIERYVDKYQADLTYHQLCVIANTLCLNNKLKEAFDLCMRAMRMDANASAAPEVLFWIYHNKGDKQAFTVIDRLIESGPANRRSDYLYWKAVHANNQSLPDVVLACVKEAGGPPDVSHEKYQEIIYSTIAALCALSRIEEAEEIAGQVPEELMFETRYLPMAFAEIYKNQGRSDEVVRIYDRFLEKNPGVIEARWNRALANLTIGQLDKGWEDFECRWDWASFPSTEKKFSIPKWNGQDLSGKSILLWAEQGLGDQIMFLSLALPLIQNRQIRVAIEVGEKLVDVVCAWYPEAHVSALENFDCIDSEQYAEFDYHLPIGSLTKHFLPNIDAVRSRPIRFLRSDQKLKNQLMELSGFDPELPLVGICWRSSFITSQRATIYLNVFAAQKIAAELEGVCNFVSLQYDLKAHEIEVLDQQPNIFIPQDDFYVDVTSHAKHIGICDFVVTAGTVTSQLAGIFNRNTLIWGRGAWTFLGQDQYPWYPNHATIQVPVNYSKSSLVVALARWLRTAVSSITV